jgi:hypothetical protein
MGSTATVCAAETSSGNTLQSVDVAEAPGSKAQITLTLSSTTTRTFDFTIDNPARIAGLPVTKTAVLHNAHTGYRYRREQKA